MVITLMVAVDLNSHSYGNLQGGAGNVINHHHVFPTSQTDLVQRRTLAALLCSMRNINLVMFIARAILAKDSCLQ